MRRTLAAGAVLLAGCGGGSDSRPAQPAAHATKGRDATIIRAWADALRGGRVSAASAYFGLPLVVENGAPRVRLTRRSQIRTFNASLPCGARLVSTRAHFGYTIATFRLTDRPGGDCGSGAGQTAATAFKIRAGKIVEWLRVPGPGEGPGPGGQPGLPGQSTS